MTEELKKQGIVDGAAVVETVEETGVAPDLDEAAKAAEREARRQALYEENERAEDERARAEAERMRDVDDEDEDETPRDTWATVRRLWSEAAGDHWRFYIVFASIVFYVIFNTAAPAYSARVIDELWGHIQVAFANDTTFRITWENCGKTIFVYFMIWTAAASFYALQSSTVCRSPILTRIVPARSSAARPTTWTRCPRACSADCCSCSCRSARLLVL